MATKHATNYLEERLLANSASLVFLRLADYYLNNDEIDRAIETCSQGLKLHPHNVTGRMVLGRCYMKQERFEEAIGVFTEVCRFDSRNLKAIKLLGDLFAQQGLSAPAGDLYRLVAAMDPFDRKMAAVAARVIGSGKTELFDILADGVGDATDATSTDVVPIEASDEEGKTAPSPDIPEIAAATINGSADFPAEETFDVLEMSGEVRGVEEAGAETMGNDAIELSLESATLEAMLPLDAKPGGADSGEDVEVTATKSSEIPDGLEISSRLDTLFGGETPASGRAAASVNIDMRGEESPVVKDRGPHAETIIKGAAAENLIEEGIDSEKQPPASFLHEQDSGDEQLLLEDSPLPTVGWHGDISESIIVTPTLAEIYFKQGRLQRALAIYRRLLEKDPGNDHLKRSIQEVKAAIASGGEGIPRVEQERGKASRKIIEKEAGGAPGASELSASEPAREGKPKREMKFKWIKRPDGER